jgi:signal transduction histidine kinase
MAPTDHVPTERVAGGPTFERTPVRHVALAVLALGLVVSLIASLWPDRVYSFHPGTGEVARVTEVPRLLSFAGMLAPFLWWLPFVPLVAAVARRADMLLHPRWRSGALHVLAGLAIPLLHVEASLFLYVEYGMARVMEHPGLLSEQVRRQALGSFLVYWLVVGITYAMDYSRLHRARSSEAAALLLKTSHLETALARARLSTLQAQLNPHFLFNTLNSISALVGWRPEDARRLIASLGELLRLTLDEGETPLATLDRELGWLAKYVEIQQIRFEEQLSVQIDAEPAARRARVPRFILQPLVENAIVHGLEKSGGPLHVRVEAKADGEMLRLIVRDDGPGLPEHSPSEGVGLSNTRRRLALLYGERHSVVLGTAPGGGAEAVITLPLDAGADERRGDLLVQELAHDG